MKLGYSKMQNLRWQIYSHHHDALMFEMIGDGLNFFMPWMFFDKKLLRHFIRDDVNMKITSHLKNYELEKIDGIVVFLNEAIKHGHIPFPKFQASFLEVAQPYYRTVKKLNPKFADPDCELDKKLAAFKKCSEGEIGYCDLIYDLIERNLSRG